MSWIVSIINLFAALTALPPTLYPLQGQRLHVRYPGGDWIIPGATLDVQGS